MSKPEPDRGDLSTTVVALALRPSRSGAGSSELCGGRADARALGGEYEAAIVEAVADAYRPDAEAAGYRLNATAIGEANRR